MGWAGAGDVLVVLVAAFFSLLFRFDERLSLFLRNIAQSEANATNKAAATAAVETMTTATWHREASGYGERICELSMFESLLLISGI